MIKIIFLVVGLLAGVVALIWIVGALLPREHKATRSARFATTPEQLFSLVTDVPSFPSWRTGVSSIDELPPVNDKTRWREHTSDGKVVYELSEMVSPSRVVTTIVSDDLPYGGKWVITFEPDGTGTKMRVTEEGFVNPPPFRFLARFIFGHTSTMERYLKDMGNKLGQDVKVEP